MAVSKRAVHVVGVGMIPFTKPGASESYNVMGARAAQLGIQHADVAETLARAGITVVQNAW